MIKTLYTASVTASGGRNGKVKSNDGVVDFEVRMPKALGGKDDNALNPELLFAAGYAACFDSALNMVLRQNRIKAETEVEANVSIGQTEDGGFGLSSVLRVRVIGVELPIAKQMMDAAHGVCPYSKATKGNMSVELIVSNK